MLNPLSSLRRVLTAVADRFAKPQPLPATPFPEAPALTDFQRVMNSALAGDPLAQHNLALRFQIGDGVRQDSRQAAHWFRQAAEQGDPNAWLKLGAYYCNGVGVARNEEQAAACFKTAANLNQPDAQCLLAYCHHIGTGVSRVEALVQALRDVGQLPKEEEDGKESQLAISTDESLAAAFARCHTGKTLTIREAATPPRPIMRFLRDQESYALFEDHSICAWSWSGPSATPHTLASLAAAVETRRKDGLPLSAAARDLLIHIVSNSQGWDEAEVDTALLLLAAADRDARLSAA